MGKKPVKNTSGNDKRDEAPQHSAKVKSDWSSVIPSRIVGCGCAVALFAFWRGTFGTTKLSDPPRLEEFLKCGAQCGALTDSDRTIIDTWMAQHGCGKEADRKRNEKGETDETCDATPEQICVTVCTQGGTDMAAWLPGAFSSSVSVGSTRMTQMRSAYAAHVQCSEQCVADGVTVDTSEPDFHLRANRILTKCGVVQLSGVFDELGSSDRVELLTSARDAIARLRGQEGRYAALLDKVMLRDGRYQLFLPFAEPFNARGLIADARIVDVLTQYFVDVPAGFGLDHISVLSSSSGSANQTLHPDVSYFPREHLSVHTALDDISLDMGPTFFCPCSGHASDDMVANIALRMLVLDRKECLGRSYARDVTPRGLVTIYDGVIFHKGLRNWSGKERHVLKMELASGDFAQRRDYLKRAPREAKRQTEQFRATFGHPRLGVVDS